MKKVIVLSSILYFFLLLSVGYSQPVGKIFTQREANILFGSVTESVSMSRSKLDSILSRTKNHVMFIVNNGELVILGDGRKVLYPAGKTISSSDVFYVVSKSKVIELLNLGSGTEIFFERRIKVFSITKDMNTLEESQPCPPDCFIEESV